MSETQDTKQAPRRNYACIGEFVDSSLPPIVKIGEDQFGPLIRTSPFGHSGGVHLCLTIELWNQWKSAVDKAISDYSATRLAAGIAL
ncbi:hypothetical protein [Mycobacterium marinum]|uniref:hypothetical protein n=1 Tax=Mycobacterium marinum TaxID=1781 RepID=UPI00356942C8